MYVDSFVFVCYIFRLELDHVNYLLGYPIVGFVNDRLL